MRILADENFSRGLVARLGSEGHDVAWVKERCPGSGDPAVLMLAQSEGRIFATFDTGFGEMAFRARLPAACGVLLFRIRGEDPALLADRAVAALSSQDDWSGKSSVITDHGVRSRPLPPSSG